MRQDIEEATMLLELALKEEDENFMLQNGKFTLMQEDNILKFALNKADFGMRRPAVVTMACTIDNPDLFDRVLKRFNLNLKEKDGDYLKNDAFAAAIFSGNYNVASYIIDNLFENGEVDIKYYNYMMDTLSEKAKRCNKNQGTETQEQLNDLMILEADIADKMFSQNHDKFI